MKVPTPIPKTIRLIEKDSFLASVETRGHLLLRARIENPGNHLLVIFTDEEERYAILGETGPEAEYADVREAVRRSPAGLAIRYLVPCAQCPPYAIPKGLAITTLPASLSALTAPPADFQPAENSGAAIEPESDSEPEPGPVFRLVSAHPAKPGEPVPAKTNRPVLPPGSPVLAYPESGVPGALQGRVSPDSEKGLNDREADLRRRETELAVKTTSLSKERRLLEDEAARINAEIDARETTLFRREGEVQASAEALLRTMNELDDLRRKVEVLAGKSSGGF